MFICSAFFPFFLFSFSSSSAVLFSVVIVATEDVYLLFHVYLHCIFLSS